MITLLLIVIIILLLYYANCNISKENFSWSNPNVTPGIIYSTWNIYDKRTAHRPGMWPGVKRMALGFHYVNHSPKCELYRPIWEKLKKDMANMEIDFIENNEDDAKTPGINSYPTIIKYENGVGEKYKGLADYEKLRSWVLNTTHTRLGYFGYI